MTRFLFKLLPIAAMFVTCGTAYAVTCTIGVTSLTAIAFDPTTALQLTGTVSGTCTPTSNAEASTPPTIYIGINLGGRTPRSMIRSGGTELVSYEINKSAGAGIWNEAAGTAVLTTNGGLLFTMVVGNKNTAQSYSHTFYLNIPAQPTDPVGTYNNPTITAKILLLNSTGASVGTAATFGLTATISPMCRFSTNPSTLNLNYTSFRTTAATGTSAFSLNCTSGTSYSQAVSPATGTALGVSYSLALNATTGLVGNAANQSYTITGTAALGQSGTCATSGTLCSATNPHSITVTF